MDIFSHAFWAAATGQGINKFYLEPKGKKPLSFWRLAFWGAFPDIFAFTIPLVWIFINLISGSFKLSDFPRPENMEPTPSNHLPRIFQLTNFLYNFSHSALVFFAIFILVFLIFRRPAWEMAGWLFHIVIDIPTHSYQFYPTPFLWPVSG